VHRALRPEVVPIEWTLKQEALSGGKDQSEGRGKRGNFPLGGGFCTPRDRSLLLWMGMVSLFPKGGFTGKKMVAQGGSVDQGEQLNLTHKEGVGGGLTVITRGEDPVPKGHNTPHFLFLFRVKESHSSWEKYGGKKGMSAF